MPLTGPAAPGYDEIAPAMNAVFGWVNAHGGVNGRKINYTYLDDGYNPANTATLTRSWYFRTTSSPMSARSGPPPRRRCRGS